MYTNTKSAQRRVRELQAPILLNEEEIMLVAGGGIGWPDPSPGVVQVLEGIKGVVADFLKHYPFAHAFRPGVIAL
jgi:hypothetical protein